jgi:small subunit ribosomal protein S6
MTEERIYELIFICRPDTPEPDVDRLINLVQQTVQEQGGRVEKAEKWGVRRLAYRVRKHREGFYVFLVIHGTASGMMKEVERRLKVSEPVIKYLTVRVDAELKRERKLRARRERRAGRRTRRGQAEAAASA